MAKGKHKRQKEARENPKIQKVLSYFAEDGNYGNAAGYVVMETTWWNDDDWSIIEETQDEFRPQVARLITESYEPEANEDALREAFARYGVDLSKYEQE